MAIYTNFCEELSLKQFSFVQLWCIIQNSLSYLLLHTKRCHNNLIIYVKRTLIKYRQCSVMQFNYSLFQKPLCYKVCELLSFSVPNACVLQPVSCENGGTCEFSEQEGSHTCKCPSGFTGVICQTSRCSENRTDSKD